MDDKLSNPSSYTQALIVDEPGENAASDKQTAKPRHEPPPKPDSWLPS